MATYDLASNICQALAPGSVVLAGFSQGAGLAVAAGRRLCGPALGGVLCLRGYLPVTAADDQDVIENENRREGDDNANDAKRGFSERELAAGAAPPPPPPPVLMLQGGAVGPWPGYTYCSPRHWMPFNSRNERSNASSWQILLATS